MTKKGRFLLGSVSEIYVRNYILAKCLTVAMDRVELSGLDIGTGPMRVLKLLGQFEPPVFKFYWPGGPVV